MKKNNLTKQIPNALTLTNLGLGFLSILFSINKDFLTAAILILIAALLDGFDGKTARLLKAESEIGSQLDSLSDLVSFGIAPALFVFNLFINHYLIYYLAPFLLVFVLCGAYRLAKFNVLKTKVEGYLGMPITLNGLIFPLLFFITRNIYIFSVLLIISSILMISNIKFNKVFK